MARSGSRQSGKSRRASIGTGIEQILLKPIRRLQLHRAVHVSADFKISEVIRALRFTGEEAAVVTKGRVLEGFLTWSEMGKRALGQDLALDQVPAAYLMVREPLTLSANSTLALALKSLLAAGIERAPVVEEDGTVLGVVSTRLIGEHLAEHFPESLLNRPGGTLEEILAELSR